MLFRSSLTHFSLLHVPPPQMQPSRSHPPLKTSPRRAWEPLTKCGWPSNPYRSATVALAGEHGVDGPWRDRCCGASIGGSGACMWCFPLWVVNRLDDLNWRGLWWQIEMGWWWLQKSNVMVAVVGIGPRVSRGVIGDWEATRWLGVMVVMVAVAECGPQIF